MALVVNTNIASLVAQKNLAESKGTLDQALERLSSGSRINSASDDAAGLAISSRMEAQVRGLNQAVRNANDGISMTQTAEGAMEEITSMLQRMREISVQAASGTNTTQDLSSLDAEMQALKSEIDRIKDTTQYNGKNLLDGSLGTNFHIGADANQTITLSVSDMGTSSLGSITGAASGSAVTSGSWQGEEATKSVSKLTFNANDTYNFALTVGGLDAGAGEYTFNVTGDVVNGSAKGIVDAINAALRDVPQLDDGVAETDVKANAADSIRASYSGSTVTIENLTGSTIKVEAGTYGGVDDNDLSGTISNTGSTVAFTSVTTGDTKTLGGSDAAATSLINNGPTSVTTSGGVDAVASTIELGIYTDNETDSALDFTLEGGDQLHFQLTSGSQTIDLDTGSMNDTADLAAVVSELGAALTNTGSSDYTITAGSTGIKITRADGADFTVKLGANHDLTAGDNDQAIAVVTPDLAASGSTASANSARSFDNDGTAELSISFDDTNIADPGNDGDLLLDSGDSFKFKLESVSDGSTVTVDTGSLSAAAADNDVTNAELASAMQVALTNAGATAYTVAATTGDTNAITITRSDGEEFLFTMTEEAITASVAVNQRTEDVLLDAVGESVVANNGTIAVPGTTTTPESASIMYLDFLANDTYTLKGAGINSSNAIEAGTTTSGVSIEYTGTTASLEDAAAKLQAELNAIVKAGTTFDFTVTAENGRLKVSEGNGNKFAITGFESAGSGRVAASVPVGQQVSGAQSSVLLDDTTYDTTASTSAAGTVKVTDIDMTFGSNDDEYSFTISDGTATADVALTAVDASENGSDILAAVNVALDRAGMDDTVTAEVTPGDPANDVGPIVTLKHSLGYELSIANFVSTGNQDVKVEVGDAGDTTGVSKFLDDNGGGGNSSTVSNIAVTTTSLAADAIDIIDRALEDVNSERSQLGAIQNRLDHTINNLTNISVNVSAAQSRIQDADYAVEAANLAKAQILQQAGSAMLAQANAAPQTILSLLG